MISNLRIALNYNPSLRKDINEIEEYENIRNLEEFRKLIELN